MTLVRFDLRDDFEKPAKGSIHVSPARRVHVNGNPDYISLGNPVAHGLSGGVVEIELRPTEVDLFWMIRAVVPRGLTRYVVVPDSSTTLDYGDLQEVDPGTIAPLPPDQQAIWKLRLLEQWRLTLGPFASTGELFLRHKPLTSQEIMILGSSNPPP